MIIINFKAYLNVCQNCILTISMMDMNEMYHIEIKVKLIKKTEIAHFY